MISRYKIGSLVIIFFLALSCNKTTTKETTDENKVNTEKINSDIFPHEKDFFKKHGSSYLINKEQCLSCHGADGSGGSANVSCTNCHQDGGRFPHPKNWVMADQHSTEFMKSPQSCSTCHGADWKGGTSKVSCLQCHDGYPHPLKWSSPENHGKFYVQLKEKKDCLNCHQSNKVPANATRCDSCHKAYPHEKGFGTGNKRHRTLSQTYDGKCLNCHQDYKANMPNYQDESEGVGCINCHEGTIQLKWVTPDEDKKTGALNNVKKSRVPSATPHKINKKHK